ncbi:MAG: hypothetical protein ABFD16_25270 [Thermoguttaceae bacterium]
MLRLRRIVLMVALGLALFVCSLLLHELGHLAAGLLCGAEIQGVHKAILLGNPYISLTGVHAEITPWVDAGGILLPTAVALALVLWWWVTGHRVSLFLLPLAAAVLLLNLRLFGEVATVYDAHHMDRLAKTFTENGLAVTAIEVLPAVLSLVVLALMGRRLLSLQRGTPFRETGRSHANPSAVS